MVLSTRVVSDLLASLDSETLTVSTFAFLTDNIFSWTVSIIPDDSKVSVAKVEASDDLFWSSSMRTNSFLPVSNLGFTSTFGSGMKKLPCSEEA